MAGFLIAPDPPAGDWLPVWAGPAENEFVVEWGHIGDKPLREPFFQDSVEIALRRPINQLLRHRTAADALSRLQVNRPGLLPRGFIFHTSRCGSTLVAQMLTVVRGSVVLSEPPPIDGVLSCVKPAAPVDEDRRKEWLIGMINALGRPRRADDRHLFVKFDAWHVLDLPLIRSAFPDTPWVFLYRDPREVLASQLRQPAAFLIPGMLPGPAMSFDAGPGQSTLSERFARLFGRLADAALAALSDGNGIPVNYSELPGVVVSRLAAHFGIDLAPLDEESMAHGARFDAKSPAMTFEPRADAAPELSEFDRQLIETHAMPGYRALERARNPSQT